MRAFLRTVQLHGTITARIVPFMKRLLTLSLLAYLACAPLGLVHAEKADRNKPMNIEADALRHDDLQQASVFTGHVVMTKGSIVLRGARLEVRQDADGYQIGTVTGEAGKRAFFRQQRDTAPGATPEFVEGEAEVIEYSGRADTVRFLRRAELRRYRGTVLSDDISGTTIVYYNLTDVFTVDGPKASANAPAAPGSRVRAVLSPKESSAGTAPVPGAPGPALRPIDPIGNDKP
jgi:lipopolysaccharide export system protein LptA